MEDLSRTLFLTGSINEESCRELIESIVKVNEFDDLEDQVYFEDKCKSLEGVQVCGEITIPPLEREPIKLYIDSGGGEVYSGFALVNAIENSVTPVITIVVGKAMSMSLIIAMAGDYRYGYKKSRFMYHDISTGMWTDLTDIKREVTELEELSEQYNRLIKEWSYITQEMLDYKLNRRENWYFGGLDAYDVAVIDELIDDEYEGKCDSCGKPLDECGCDIDG